SRFKEERPGGLKTGIIRSMAGTGSVVTSAGLVFAATMATFVLGDLIVMGQVGTTIALGLLFDTLIVRSFMTPSIAALLGRWFWWPLNVRQRPVPQTFASSDPKKRQLPLWEDEDPAVRAELHHRREAGACRSDGPAGRSQPGFSGALLFTNRIGCPTLQPADIDEYASGEHHLHHCGKYREITPRTETHASLLRYLNLSRRYLNNLGRRVAQSADR